MTFCSTTWHDGQGENWVRLCSVYCCNHSKHSREEGNRVHIISSRRTLLLPRPMSPTPSPQPHSKPVVASASWSFASPLAVRWLIVVWICSSHDDSGMETWRWWQMIQWWERTKAHQKKFFLFWKKNLIRGLTCCFVNRHWGAARWRMRKKRNIFIQNFKTYHHWHRYHPPISLLPIVTASDAPLPPPCSRRYPHSSSVVPILHLTDPTRWRGNTTARKGGCDCTY